MAIMAKNIPQMSKIWLLFAACCIGGCQPAQKEGSEELIHACREAKEKLKTHYRVDSARAILIVKKLKQAFPKSDYVKVRAHIGYAAIYERWENRELALYHTKAALKMAQMHHYYQEEAEAYLQRLELANNHEEALEDLQKFEALRIAKNINDSALLWRFYNDYGYYHYGLKDYTVAKSYFLKALDISRKNKLYLEESQNLYALSTLSNDEQKYIPALALIENAINKGLHCCPIECGDYYYQKGVTLAEMGRYKEAEMAILEADKIYKEHPHPYKQGAIEVVLGEIYMNQKNYKAALRCYTTFLNKAQFTSTKIWAYNTLSNYYMQTKAYQMALVYNKKLTQLKDSVYSAERIQLLMNREAQFELAQQELQFKETQLRYQFTLLISLLMVVLVTITTVFVYRNGLLKTKLAKAKQVNLQQNIELNQRKLATKTLHLSQYKDSLRHLKKEIEQLNSDTVLSVKTQVREITKFIDNNLKDDHEWDNFKLHFEAVSPHFFEMLKARTPSLTELDLKHCAYIKMNLTPKQVAQLLGVSPKSVTLSRVRIKKKLQLDKDEQLLNFLHSV